MESLIKGKKPDRVIDAKAVLWDILEQWKAVLIVALLVMLVFAVGKYRSDMSAYKAAQQQLSEESEAELPVEQRIDEVLNALPGEKKDNVEYVLKQNEWIEKEKEYLNNSILMNTDLTNQRTLNLEYYIEQPEGYPSAVNSILNGYKGYLKDDDITDVIAEPLGVEGEKKYIAELITVGDSNNEKSSDEGSALMKVSVVIPDGADAEAVEKAISSAISEYSSVLTEKIGPHRVILIRADESYLNNSDAIKKRSDSISSLYTKENIVKAKQATLSAEEIAAIEAISTIKEKASVAEESIAVAKEAAAKPSFSGKYAILGLLLGAFLYALAYLALVIFRGRINSAAEAGQSTRTRLLGEIYDRKKATGLSALLHSKTVEKMRYKEKTDTAAQITKTADAIEAVCGHAGTGSVNAINMAKDNGSCIEALTASAKSSGINANVTDAAAFKEKSLNDMPHTLLIAGPDTKSADLAGMTSLLADYDAELLGCIYIDPAALSE